MNLSVHRKDEKAVVHSHDVMNKCVFWGGGGDLKVSAALTLKDMGWCRHSRTSTGTLDFNHSLNTDCSFANVTLLCLVTFCAVCEQAGWGGAGRGGLF